MKKFILPLMMIGFLLSSFAQAYKADPYKGWYLVLSKSAVASQLSFNDKQYMFIDVDTLGNIWTKYADGPLPPDLEKYKNEPTILAAFTDRDTIFLSFESNAVFGNGYLAVQGSGTNLLELGLRGDGRYDMGIIDKEVVSKYLLAAPTPDPSLLRKLPSFRLPNIQK